MRLKLTQGKEALVDADTYAWASKLKWQAAFCYGMWYAQRTDRTGGRKRTVRLHREIMNPGPGEVVDHINGDGLDCRRANMRNCTQQQNTWNQKPKGRSSSYRGVSWHPRQKKWIARIRQDGALHHIGSFANEKDAALAYDGEAVSRFGQYARPNFPMTGV